MAHIGHIGKAMTAALCAGLLACAAACESTPNSAASADATAQPSATASEAAISEKDIVGHKFTYGTIEFEFTDTPIGELDYGDAQTAPIYAFKVRTDADDISYDGDPAWRGYTVTAECVDSYAEGTWRECPSDTLFLLTGKTVRDETITEPEFQNAGFEVTKEESGTLNLQLVTEGDSSTAESTALLTKSMPSSFAVANTIQLEAE